MTDQNRKFDSLRVCPVTNIDGTRYVYGGLNEEIRLAGRLMPVLVGFVPQQPKALVVKLLERRLVS